MATSNNNSVFDEDLTTVPAEDEYTSLVSHIECLPDASENLEESDNETDSVGFCEPLEQIYSLSISTGGNTMEDTARSKMEQFFKTDQSVSILFAGKTGAGKSSLINGLVGRNIATEGASPHSITGLSSLKQPYEGEYVRAEGARVKVIVWDSPGLQDGHHRDREYLHRLQRILSRVDLVVYCISMKERFDSGARKALKAFGELRPQVWQNAVVALTHANHIIYPDTCHSEEDEFEYFNKILKEWASDIGGLLQQCNIPKDIVEELPVIPTGYHRVTRNTPHPWRLHVHCNHWLQPFWFTCLVRCREMARAGLIMSNTHRLSTIDLFIERELDTQPIECQPLLLDHNPTTTEENTYQIGGRRVLIRKIWSFLQSILPFLKHSS